LPVSKTHLNQAEDRDGSRASAIEAECADMLAMQRLVAAHTADAGTKVYANNAIEHLTNPSRFAAPRSTRK